MERDIIDEQAGDPTDDPGSNLSSGMRQEAGKGTGGNGISREPLFTPKPMARGRAQSVPRMNGCLTGNCRSTRFPRPRNLGPLHIPKPGALRIEGEFVAGIDALAEVGAAVSVFGSARFPELHPMYTAARSLGQILAKAGFAVITGGGPGLMEAANRGAHEAGGIRSASISSCRLSKLATGTPISASTSAIFLYAKRCSSSSPLAS